MGQESRQGVTETRDVPMPVESIGLDRLLPQVSRDSGARFENTRVISPPGLIVVG